jgi:hypothetical protein
MALIAFAGCSALADAVSLAPMRDATLTQNALGELGDGSGQNLRVGTTGLGVIQRAALVFDITASIPRRARIISAALILNNTNTAQSPLREITVHRLRSDWGEGPAMAPGGQGVPAGPGDSTWLYRFYNPADPTASPAWDSPGGDFAHGASASADVGGNGYYSWSSRQLARDVQLWLERPQRNHGWLLLGEEDTLGGAKKLGSRENDDATVRPALLIEFTTRRGHHDDEHPDD